MRLLFIHQNFPGQYRHLVHHFGSQKGHEIACVGESQNLLRWEGLPGVRVHGYSVQEKKDAGHPYALGFENSLRRGQAVAVTCTEIKKSGFVPDVICVHSGWGEGLFLKDVFPDAKILMYCEFFYNAEGSDFNFERKKRPTLDELFFLRTRNATQCLSFMQADAGISPTVWQKSQYPDIISQKITVLHEGVDTARFQPDNKAVITLSQSGLALRPGDKVVTFVNRNLEPYRGFRTFLHSIPLLQQKHPDAQILIVGADGRGYGAPAPKGTTYRKMYMNEIKEKADIRKIHFLGHVPHGILRQLYQVSAAHVYLTFPFVLSWSMLEAMSCQCLVIGSKTPPVQEVLKDGENGLLVDFFSPEQVAGAVCEALDGSDRIAGIRERARKTIVDKYDLRSVSLPQYDNLLASLA